MSARLIAAAARQFPTDGPPSAEGPPIPPVMLAREAVALLAHETMVYACGECGFEWRVWLSLGVEGPPQLRESGLYVACPFTAGRCPSWPVKPDATEEERAQFRHLTTCDGTMGHVRFGDDETFPAPRLIPDDAPRFVLDDVHDSARLSIPEPAIVAARRFHDEAATA